MADNWIEDWVTGVVTRSSNMAIDVCADMIERWPMPIQDRELLVSALLRLKRADDNEVEGRRTP